MATAQKAQLLVHTLPKIMKVAVPAPQHSPMLGQLPLVQIVWSLCWSTMLRIRAYSLPTGSLARSHEGLLGGSAVLLVAGSIVGVRGGIFVNRLCCAAILRCRPVTTHFFAALRRWLGVCSSKTFWALTVVTWATVAKSVPCSSATFLAMCSM